MAKRFTDTEKWKDPWFDNLSGVGKLFFYYLLDMVDCAGIWKTNFGHFKKNTGFVFSHDDITREFSEKLMLLDNGNYFLTNFIKFQYGTLNKTNNAHKGVFKSLDYNNIETSPYLAPNKPLPSPTAAPFKGAQDKDKDKDNINNYEQCVKKAEWDVQANDEVYASYQFAEGYPRNVFDEFAKEAWPLFEASDDPKKIWKRFLANYIKNAKPRIREAMIAASKQDKSIGDYMAEFFPEEESV